jgi:uncharacterized protein
LITIHKGGKEWQCEVSELPQVTAVPYLSGIQFVDFRTLRKVARRTKEGSMDAEHKWLSAYFRQEVLDQTGIPPVSLRWIDDEIGWGVFAERDLQKTEFIAKYSGIVRKRVRRDAKNAYCFEYPLEIGEPSPYVIDAQDIGGISRYINHSSTPNLSSLSVHIEGFNHIILFTIKKIPKGEQLCYDYGPGYWQARGTPRNFK